MATVRRDTGGRGFRTLFQHGVVGDLSDGELLGRFAAGGEAAELAFAALVDRHGPMVLRVCRSVLQDEHAAEDAFQATFLVLARRAGSIRRRNSVGSWLHGAAVRIAGSSRASAARRRRHERRAAELAVEAFHEVRNEAIELGPILHDELARLPGRYREAIVLCYLEGLTCEETAGRLGWAIGTVKSRLSRGRERLRVRLIRRGLPAAVAAFMSLLAVESASAAPAAMLVESTVAIAAGFAAGGGLSLASVPAPVAALAGRISVMTGPNRMTAAWAAILLAAAAFGVSVFARATPAVIVAREKAVEKEEPGPRPADVLRAALRAVDQVDIVWIKANALMKIASLQARAGQADASEATFRRATGIIDGMGEDSIPYLASLVSLAAERANAGEPEATRRAVARLAERLSRLNHSGTRDSSIESACKSQAGAGDIQGALEILRAVPAVSPAIRASTLSEIAGSLARKDLRRAREIMAEADLEAARAEPGPGGWPGWRDAMHQARIRGMTSLAEVEARAGEVDAARATIRRARAAVGRIREENRPDSLARIAMAQRQAGDLQVADLTLRQAIGIARAGTDPNCKATTLGQLATVVADAGDPTTARRILGEAIHLERPREDTIADQVLSVARASVGDWEGGPSAVLCQVGTAFLSIRIIEDFAFRQGKAGEARGALKWAEAQEYPPVRASALLGVARGIIERDATTGKPSK